MVGHVDVKRSRENIRQHSLDPPNHTQNLLPVVRNRRAIGAVLTRHDYSFRKEWSYRLAPQSNGHHATVKRSLRRNIPAVISDYDGGFHGQSARDVGAGYLTAGVADNDHWPDARVAKAIHESNLQGGAERLGYLGEVDPAVSLRLLQLPYEVVKGFFFS